MRPAANRALPSAWSRATCVLALCSVLASCAGSSSQREAVSEPSGKPPQLVVLVSVAGLGTRETTGDGGAPAMPRLAALGAKGVVAERVEATVPGTPLPVAATLVTGRVAARHGVTGDLALGDRGIALPAPADHGIPRGRTLWSAATEKRLSVATLGWPGTEAAAPQLAASFPPAVAVAPERWPALLAARTTPVLLDIARPLGAESPEISREGAARDRLLVDLACALVARPGPPALVLLRLAGALPVLVGDGPATAAARAAFERVDQELERLRVCIARTPLRDASALVVAGDSHFASLHTVLSPNAVLADAGLLVPSPSSPLEVLRWSAFVRPSGGSAFLHARDEEDALLARRALEASARASGSFRVVSAEELATLGADPEAWFGLDAEPGFAFGISVMGPVQRPTTERGAAGHLASAGETTPGFVAYGAGIRAGVRYPVLRQIDVAPTIAALLGLALGESDGRPLVGALAPGIGATLKLEPVERERGEGGR